MEYLAADDALLERMVRAVERVRDRLRRAAAALEAGSVPYLVAGGNAVAAWVATIDEAAIRNTQDVDIIIRREDLASAVKAMEAAGFTYRHAAGIDMFLDGPSAKFRDAVHILFAHEKVKEEYVETVPGVDKSFVDKSVRFLPLDSLVIMKLTSFRDKDRTHLRDLISIGLLDAAWLDRLQPLLAERLKQLLDTPEG
jgi:hypothetical protein